MRSRESGVLCIMPCCMSCGMPGTVAKTFQYACHSDTLHSASFQVQGQAIGQQLSQLLSLLGSPHPMQAQKQALWAPVLRPQLRLPQAWLPSLWL